MKNKYAKLILCLFLDAVGYLSYVVFGLGETIDVVWAPLAGWLNYRLFKEEAGIGGALFTFVEEALPATDFIPSFTLTWLYVYFFSRKKKPTIIINDE
ncbi:MAG: hypothetical protein KGV44_10115 [Flavobacteriaceae bacterium]|nr:hypothetical protein [Flavobacteriaceae bacterium]MBS9767878.1 hypothetical protein [Flavobacteriaceae bacterium]